MIHMPHKFRDMVKKEEAIKNLEKKERGK